MKDEETLTCEFCKWRGWHGRVWKERTTDVGRCSHPDMDGRHAEPYDAACKYYESVLAKRDPELPEQPGLLVDPEQTFWQTTLLVVVRLGLAIVSLAIMIMVLGLIL